MYAQKIIAVATVVIGVVILVAVTYIEYEEALGERERQGCQEVPPCSK